MPEAPKALVVGRITKSHGVRGEVVVEVLSEVEDRFGVGSVMNAGARALKIKGLRPHQDRLLVTFEGVSDRDDADELRGALLSIPLDEAAEPPAGRYYAYQLEGLEVRDESGKHLGRLSEVLEAPAHDVWVVRTPYGPDAMVPVVDEFVRSVDLEAGVIVIAPIEGMFE